MRLALVEHHELFAETLDIVLAMNGHAVARVAMTDRDGAVDGLVGRVLAARPEAAVLDLDGPVTGDPADAIPFLTGAGVDVVALTCSGSPARWGQCLDLGARRVVPKTASLQAVVGALRRIENRIPVVSAGQRQALIALWHRERTAQDAVSTLPAPLGRAALN